MLGVVLLMLQILETRMARAASQITYYSAQFAGFLIYINATSTGKRLKVDLRRAQNPSERKALITDARPNWVTVAGARPDITASDHALETKSGSTFIFAPNGRDADRHPDARRPEHSASQLPKVPSAFSAPRLCICRGPLERC